MKKHIHTCPTFLGVRNCALLPGINTPCTHKKDQARKSRFQGTNFHQWISNIWIDSARLASFAKAEIGIQWYSEWPSQVPRFISLELLYLRKSIPTIQIVKLWRSQELHMVFWNMEALLSKRILLHIFATNRPLDERDTFKHWVNLSSYRLVQFYSSCYFNFISKKILVLCKKKLHSLQHTSPSEATSQLPQFFLSAPTSRGTPCLSTLQDFSWVNIQWTKPRWTGSTR